MKWFLLHVMKSERSNNKEWSARLRTSVCRLLVFFFTSPPVLRSLLRNTQTHAHTHVRQSQGKTRDSQRRCEEGRRLKSRSWNSSMDEQHTHGRSSPLPPLPGRTEGWCAGGRSAWTRSEPGWRLREGKTHNRRHVRVRRRKTRNKNKWFAVLFYFWSSSLKICPSVCFIAWQCSYYPGLACFCHINFQKT